MNILITTLSRAPKSVYGVKREMESEKALLAPPSTLTPHVSIIFLFLKQFFFDKNCFFMKWLIIIRKHFIIGSLETRLF